MTPSELEAALIRAIQQCEAESCPLSEQQQQILRRLIQSQSNNLPEVSTVTDEAQNPLDELTPNERQALLAFIKAEEIQERTWKISLLNDWIAGRDSGAVQFVRDRYGVQWLERVQPFHLMAYGGAIEEPIRLRVGDRIEVTNGLWEWVQEEGPCGREWFSCTVIQVMEADSANPGGATSLTEEARATGTGEPVPTQRSSCIVRFDTGDEYEIQGVYDWNRPNWRWIKA